jgi:type I restriction enzyme S subunit
MASEWQERPLAELTENFDSIRVPVKESDRRSGPYPYYDASGIVDYVDAYLFDGEYHLVWTRDIVESAMGLLAAGETHAPVRL